MKAIRKPKYALFATTFLVTSIALATFGPVSAKQKVTVEISKIELAGKGEQLGTVTLEDTKLGLSFEANLSGLQGAGEHGFHVHEKGTCAAGEKDGKPEPGLAAGKHFDPKDLKSHQGPAGGGHQGDLPKLISTGGTVAQTGLVPRLKLEDIAGRALIIHEGGDNYSDVPENGGGGGRIACGVIPK